MLAGIRLRLRNLSNRLETDLKVSLSQTKDTLQIHDLPVELYNQPQESQLEKIRRRNTVRVAVMGDKAYWVHDYIFYESDVVDGHIDNGAARPINTDKMSHQQVNLLMSVLDIIS